MTRAIAQTAAVLFAIALIALVNLLIIITLTDAIALGLVLSSKPTDTLAYFLD